MATVGAQAGLKMIAYRNTGTYGTPVWTAVTTVRDLNLNITKSMADGSARLSTWKGNLPTLKDASLEYEILRTRLLTDHDALRDSFLNDTVIDMALADQAIATSGTEYMRADWLMAEFSRKEPLGGPVTVAIKQVPYVLNNQPGFTAVP